MIYFTDDFQVLVEEHVFVSSYSERSVVVVEINGPCNIGRS